MTALAELIDAVIGVDTHRDTLAAAAVSALGGVLAHLQVPPTLLAIGSCWSSPTGMLPELGAGRWKVPAITVPG